MASRAQVAVVLGVMLFDAAAGAQTPAFEVASVKPSGSGGSTGPSAMPRVLPLSGGRFTAANIPFRMLVAVAFDVEDERIIGGPSFYAIFSDETAYILPITAGFRYMFSSP